QRKGSQNFFRHKRTSRISGRIIEIEPNLTSFVYVIMNFFTSTFFYEKHLPNQIVNSLQVRLTPNKHFRINVGLCMNKPRSTSNRSNSSRHQNRMITTISRKML